MTFFNDDPGFEFARAARGPTCFIHIGMRKTSTTSIQSALQKHIGSRLGLKEFLPAAGVTEIVEENMANAARVHAIERGHDRSRLTRNIYQDRGCRSSIHRAIKNRTQHPESSDWGQLKSDGQQKR